MMRAALPIDDYRAQVGTEVGVSDWILVDQARIDAFAEVTGDHQFIHVDPVRGGEDPVRHDDRPRLSDAQPAQPMMAYGALPGDRGRARWASITA